MDLQARPLQYFIAVAQERSFSRAAQRLHVAQPSLSAQIRELERVLGFALFQRTSRQVALSREGRLFLAEAQRMVAEAARLNRAARDIRHSELRIGAAIYSVLIPERVALIEGFSDAHDDIRTHVENSTQAQQFVALRRGELDLSIAMGIAGQAVDLVGPAIGPPSEIVFPADFERLTIARRVVRLVVPREMELSRFNPIPLAALKGVRIAILSDLHGAELIDAIAAPLTQAGAELIVPAEANAISVERYGLLKRMPAIALGWFKYGQDMSTMVPRAVEGLHLHTDLALLRLHADTHRPAIETFWAHAAAFAARD